MIMQQEAFQKMDRVSQLEIIEHHTNDFIEQIKQDKAIVLDGVKRITDHQIFKEEVDHLMKSNKMAEAPMHAIED